jgi:large subunit ribosomal protein L25
MIFNLEATKRTTVRKSDLTALRASGMIPAVLYGKSMESLPIAINKGEFQQCYKKSFNELSFYEIKLDGKKYHTILKDKLVHPVSRNILHIDFMVVQASAMMEFDIPIQFTGEPVGTKEGGFTDIIQRIVKITCKAKDIPEEIKLDISGLGVGDSLHVKDLPQGKWHYKDHPDVTLVVIHAKKQEEEAKPAEAAPAAAATEEKSKE